MLMARSGHTAVRSLARYARVSAEALQRHQAERDPALRRRTAVGPGAREDRHPFPDRPGRVPVSRAAPAKRHPSLGRLLRPGN
jgi:hypothetical protein